MHTEIKRKMFAVEIDYYVRRRKKISKRKGIKIQQIRMRLEEKKKNLDRIEKLVWTSVVHG